ncbi:MAG TPA: (d)CMP kinase [Deltaproteobacteria bacterium]|nr:(d)CMP kinase [Deltaproteobacteria bacterium]HOC76891.1 (d)CMP kinase [Deltaproteobacteria bacterium]HPA76800.1 (d)CMP kinase [Deltaproteobacteria bacterium]HPO34289.1 (d)CMP kinase [Deltaproteobacteria bacterium]HQM73532.1 (d)CMP kinase [Deltaproteobacteria bacterium]
MKHAIITIDGPAGSGKSTVAREVASRLGFTFLDTGALYRAAAIAVHEAGVDVRDDPACGAAVHQARIDLSGGRVSLNDRDVTEEIRSPRISDLASTIAVHPSVRRELLGIQRSFSQRAPVVVEGRDTGSVVFPHADLKIYLDAAPAERARRRHAELATKGADTAVGVVLTELVTRDRRDGSRSVSPLVIPEHAVVVDTTHLSFGEVVEKVLFLARERLTD